MPLAAHDHVADTDMATREEVEQWFSEHVADDHRGLLDDGGGGDGGASSGGGGAAAMQTSGSELVAELKEAGMHDA